MTPADLSRIRRETEALLERAARAIAETNALLTRAGVDPGKPIGGENLMIIHIKDRSDIGPSVESAEKLPADTLELIIPAGIEDSCLAPIREHILARNWIFTARRPEGDSVHRCFERGATQPADLPAPYVDTGRQADGTPAPERPLEMPTPIVTDPFRPGHVPTRSEVAGWLEDADRVDARNARHAMVERYLVTGEMDPAMPIGILTHLSPVRDYIEGSGEPDGRPK